jgi:hypothetical protein
MTKTDILGEKREDREKGGHGRPILDLSKQLVALRMRIMPSPSWSFRFLRVIIRIWSLSVRLYEYLHLSINYETEPFFFFQQQCFASDQFPGLHRPSQLMEYRPFKITEDFNGAEELVNVVGQASLGIALLAVREDFDLGFLSLWLRREPRIHRHESVAHKVAHSRDQEKNNQHPVPVS